MKFNPYFAVLVSIFGILLVGTGAGALLTALIASSFSHAAVGMMLLISGCAFLKVARLV